ncbi:hypothetical protein JTB14_020938 [Gonioctena quinquepunctata]|nr:hypothetical protein JTB14_020938 [Gonioctena quinquepunctata]
MLYLLENQNDGKIFYLLNQIEFVVGRKDCDILLQNDQSISRKHGVIRIKEDRVTLEDCGSKYKTIHRGVEVTPNKEIILKNDDVIQFGVISSKFIFKQHDFVTTGTRLSSTRKTKLKKDLILLGGTFTENWTSDCTHLTVEEITLTVKVLHALIDEKPIVVPTYWAKFAENAAKSLPPPNINEYNDPPMAEALLNKIELKNCSSRKGLFKGKTFMFLKEKSKKQMEDVIRKAGGVPTSWEKDSKPLEDIINSPKEFLLIQTPDQEEDESFNEIIKHFSKKGKRTIPLQEIAMAIVYGSCEKDCNPSFNRAGEVFPTTRAREPTQNNALVQNTESECFSMDICKREDDENKMVIPDTFDPSINVVKVERRSIPARKQSENNEPVVEKDTSKRVRSEQEHGNPFKKIKVEKERTNTRKEQQETLQSSKKDTSKQKIRDAFLSKAPQKRKAEEEPNLNEVGKEDKANPFALIMKRSRNDTDRSSKKVNPFSAVKKPSNTTTQTSEDNPFKSVRNKSNENNNGDVQNILTSTRLNNKSLERIDYSRISKNDSLELNSTWLSKNVTSEVKTEEEYDTEMQNFVDLFKNKVVVEVLAAMSVRPRVSADITDGINCSSAKNFKKFRKVKPLHPQSVIIGKENFVALCSGDTTGINDTRRALLPDSDDESVTKINKEDHPKNFSFE